MQDAMLSADGRSLIPTKYPSIVRVAVPADEDQVMELMQKAYAEQPIFPLNLEKMRAEVSRATHHEGGVLGVIEGATGRLEAYLIAVPAQYWYSDAWHLEELSNFVDPEVRAHRPGHAKALIEFAKWFAETMQLPLLMGILSTQRLEAKIRLYRRQVVPCGAVFVHNTGYINGLLSDRG